MEDEKGSQNHDERGESLVDSINKLTLEEKRELDDNTANEIYRKTGLVYDERMQKHFNIWDKSHPECPQRIEKIYQKLCQSGLVDRCERIPSRSATVEELTKVHSQRHIDEMKSFCEKSPRELYKRGEEFDSIYLSGNVYECALLSAGCTLALLDAVLTDKVQNGAAIVRPPGHHACSDYPMGFCYFNNVAIAAHIAKTEYGLNRILIVDWDIHWGNGTQKFFEDDASVLYMSLHRYDNMNYWPHQKEADHSEVGKGDGAGKTIHIAWNKKGMGDSEYLAAFNMIIMPVAYKFKPDLVLVSSGFDSGIGDPKGLCCVTPEVFSQMTHLLMGLANGRVLLILEGGYNLGTISYSMESCVKTLLGDPCPSVDVDDVDKSGMESILNTAKTHSKYWKCLKWAANISGQSEEAKNEKIESSLKGMEIKEKEEEKIKE